MTFSRGERVLVLKTRVFQLWDEKYQGDNSMPRLAQATGISRAHLYRVRRGDRKITATFIVGVAKAFPEYKLDDLFYVQRRDYE